MKDLKHTPGPWSHGIHINAAQHTTNPCVSIGKEMIEIPSDLYSSFRTKEAEANAKLIAATPELLEALIKIAEGSDKYSYAEIISIAQEAISKATT